MLVRLDLDTSDRWTHLIGDFEILHGPVTAALMTEAGYAATAEGVEARTVQVCQFVARAIIRDWRGVVDDATDQPLPVTDATVNAVLDVYPIFRAFNDRVIDARVRIEREKKDSSSLPPGSSDPVPDTAPTAQNGAPSAPSS
ncbi:MAG: hypothetical protein V4659_03875 [Pseudomonadota bacterium]